MDPFANNAAAVFIKIFLWIFLSCIVLGVVFGAFLSRSENKNLPEPDPDNSNRDA